MNRKTLYGFAVVVAIPLVVVVGFGLTLLGHAHKLPWQETSTRIPVTPFANLPSDAESSTAVVEGSLAYDSDVGSYDPTETEAAEIPTTGAGTQTDGYGAAYRSAGNDGSVSYAGAEPRAPGTASPEGSPAAGGSPVAVPAGATTFAIAGDQSEAKITVHQKLTALPDPNDAVLTTRAFQGQLVLGPDGQPTGESKIQVDLRTLESDEPDRDNYIRGNTLQSDQFPIAEFAITGVENWPGPLQPGQQSNFRLDGQMTIHGMTKPVTFDATAILNGDVITGTATTSFTFQDFGMSPPDISGFVKAEDTIKLDVTITAAKS
jgi:polyisoprenoid-binding protein YceI